MSEGPEGAELWERHAEWWQAGFTDGADPENVEQILPLIRAWLPASGRVLDVGTGEGQVARLAAGAGLQVVGIDPAWAQISEAARRGAGPPPASQGPADPADPADPPHSDSPPHSADPPHSDSPGPARGPAYARAGANCLPVRSASLDAVIACLVFEHIRDVRRAIAEVGRTLRVGGRFIYSF